MLFIEKLNGKQFADAKYNRGVIIIDEIASYNFNVNSIL
jgi:hypothetical protein